MSLEVNGVLVSLSCGLYMPVIQTVEDTDPTSIQYVICDYNSTHALRAGLSDPKHWGHAVYRTLDRLCTKYQRELQGGTMDIYEDTRMDRMEAERFRSYGVGD